MMFRLQQTTQDQDGELNNFLLLLNFAILHALRALELLPLNVGHVN
jgi:hypothetical protein